MLLGVKEEWRLLDQNRRHIPVAVELINNRVTKKGCRRWLDCGTALGATHGRGLQ